MQARNVLVFWIICLEAKMFFILGPGVVQRKPSVAWRLALWMGTRLCAGALVASPGLAQAADVYLNNTTPQTSGIEAAATGADAVIVTNSANISGRSGIVASSETGAISIASTGNVTSSLSWLYGIRASSNGGSIDIGGANGLSGAVSGIYAATSASGSITIRTGAGANVAALGISVRTIAADGATRIFIGSGSSITGTTYAIYADGQDVTVTNAGTVTGSVVGFRSDFGSPGTFIFNNSGILELPGASVADRYQFNNLAGGVLTGTGSLGAVNAQAGSVIRPGDRSGAVMGALNVGSLTLAAGAIVEIRANYTSGADQIAVTGAALLGGARLKIAATRQVDATWISGQTYTIMTAGSVTGTFAAPELDYAFLKATLAYTSTSVSLTLDRNWTSFSAYSTTPNQKSVSDVFDRFQTQGSNPLIAKVTTLTVGQAPVAMAQLSGAGVASTRTQSFAASSQFNGVVGSEMGEFTGSAGGGSSVLSYVDDKTITKAFDKVAAKASESILDGRVWAHGLGGVANMKADATNPAERSSNYGLAAGVDKALSPNLRAGAALSGGQSSSKVASLATKADAVWGQAALYAIATDGERYAKASLVYGRLTTETERTVTAFATPETAKGKFGANLFSTRLEVGQKFVTGRVNLTPFAAFEPSWLMQEGYSETGAATIGLGYGKTTTRALPATLGMKFDGDVVLHAMRLAPSATLGWVYNFASTSSLSPFFTSLPGSTFTVAGAKGDRNLARTELNVEAMADASTATVYANARADLGARTSAMRGTGGMMMRF